MTNSDVMNSLGEYQDRAGAETLGIMQVAPRYHAWQYEQVAPYLGRRIAELGSGVGNMSRHLLSGRPDLLLLTDTDAGYLTVLRERFGHEESVMVEPLTLPNDSRADRLRAYHLDTVVAFNVLEHIPDDVAALRSVARMLMPGGRVVILVPALPAIHGSLDVELGHARRYTRRTLGATLEAGGFAIQRLMYFNLVGAIGWWLSARVRKQSRIPIQQLRLFDFLVPLLRHERHLPLPAGQSIIGVGVLGDD